MNERWLASLFVVFVTTTMSAPTHAQLRGAVAVKGRAFAQALRDGRQPQYESNITLQLERSFQWDGRRQELTITPFVRWDPATRERWSFDFRELSWQKHWRRWVLHVGMRQVFWGAVESRNVIDVINQVDLDGRNGAGKLGQPMINVAWTQPWGTVEFFLLPWFRQRRFAGRAGRLWSPLMVEDDQPTYESSAGSRHVDWAIRWSHTLGRWDIGVGHFVGTNREPRFLRTRDRESREFLSPHYDVIDQTSVDVQFAIGPWIWKAEGATRTPSTGRYTTFAGGLEYAFAEYFSVFTEYVFDSRGDSATTSFQDDVFAGIRLITYNGELSGGLFVDRGSGNRVFVLDATRRVGEGLTLGLEARLFGGKSGDEPLYALRQDTNVALILTRFF